MLLSIRTINTLTVSTMVWPSGLMRWSVSQPVSQSVSQSSGYTGVRVCATIPRPGLASILFAAVVLCTRWDSSILLATDNDDHIVDPDGGLVFWLVVVVAW